MRILMLMAVLLSAWVARGEAPYELVSVQPWQKKDVNVAVQAFSKELETPMSIGGFSLNIGGVLYVEGREETFNNLPPFDSLDALLDRVRRDYCREEHTPRGTIFFKSRDPNLIRTVPAGHGTLKGVKGHNIKIGYMSGHREVVIYEDIFCE